MTGRQQLAAFMERKQLTQEDIAAKLGVTASYVSFLLSGDRSPSLRLAVKIQSLTGIKPTAFVEAA